jgi:hypothetical protein
MSVISEIGIKMKNAVTKKPTLDDLRASIADAEAAAAEAARVTQRKRDEYAATHDELVDNGDDLGMRRFKEEITDLERAEHRAAEDLQLRRDRLKRAEAYVAAEEHAKRVTEYERLSQLLYVRAQMIREQEEGLAASLIEYSDVAKLLQRVCDGFSAEFKRSAFNAAGADAERRTAASSLSGQVPVEECGPLFSGTNLMQTVALDMTVFTQGRWPFKYLTGDLHSLTQSPRIDDRVREYLRMLHRRFQAAGIVPPTPPRAA